MHDSFQKLYKTLQILTFDLTFYFEAIKKHKFLCTMSKYQKLYYSFQSQLRMKETRNKNNKGACA